MNKKIYSSLLSAGCSLLLATSGMAANQMSDQDQQQKGLKTLDSSQQSQQKQQQASQQQQKSQYAQHLMTPDKIDGMKIQNQQGEEIGTVDKVVLDSEQGQIAYIVVSSGGFWGIGGDKAVIPWKAVKLQQQNQQQQGQQGQQQGVAQQQQGQGQQGQPVLVLNATKDQLMNAPQGEIQDTLDRQRAEQIHKYYGVAPYWEDQQQQKNQQQQQENQQPQQVQPQQKLQQQ